MKALNLKLLIFVLLLLMIALACTSTAQPNLKIATIKDPVEWFDYGLFKPLEKYDLWVEQMPDGSFTLHYECPAVNTGNKDFIAKRGQPLPNFLRLKNYAQDGSQSVGFKSLYRFEPSCIQTFPCEYPPYPDSVMVFRKGMYDVYGNKLRNIKPGANLGQFTIDYPNYAQEPDSTRHDNTQVLPFWFDPATMSATWDSSLIRKYFWPKPVTNLSSTVNLKGKIKTVTLNWSSEEEEFEVLKNGVVLQGELYYQKFFRDTVGGGFKTATYSVISERDGVGKSEPVIIEVSNK